MLITYFSNIFKFKINLEYAEEIKVSQNTPCGYSKFVSQDAWKDAKD